MASIILCPLPSPEPNCPFEGNSEFKCPDFFTFSLKKWGKWIWNYFEISLYHRYAESFITSTYKTGTDAKNNQNKPMINFVWALEF